MDFFFGITGYCFIGFRITGSSGYTTTRKKLKQKIYIVRTLLFTQFYVFKTFWFYHLLYLVWCIIVVVFI